MCVCLCSVLLRLSKVLHVLDTPNTNVTIYQRRGSVDQPSSPLRLATSPRDQQHASSTSHTFNISQDFGAVHHDRSDARDANTPTTYILTAHPSNGHVLALRSGASALVMLRSTLIDVRSHLGHIHLSHINAD